MDIDLDSLKRSAELANDSHDDMRNAGLSKEAFDFRWQRFHNEANPAVILELIDKVRLHHFSWAGCAQQLKDAIVDLEEVEAKCKTQEAKNAELKTTLKELVEAIDRRWADETDRKRANAISPRMENAIAVARAISSPETSALSRQEECQSPEKTVRSAK